MSRITRARTSKGDNGKSEVLKGYYIPKWEKEFFLAQCKVTACKLDTIALILNIEHLLDKEDLEILERLKLIEFGNLGANIYGKLNPENFNFDGWKKYVPDEIHTLILERLEYFSISLQNAPNFTIESNEREVLISRLANNMRELEIWLWCIVEKIYFDFPNAPEATKKILSFVNCLSDYIYQLNRYISFRHGDTEVYWNQ